MKVLGVDILAGSVESKTQPKYSLVLLEGGEIRRSEEVTRYEMLKMIRDIKPDRIACDNIFELFSKDRARKFFFTLPQNTQLVQVTGSPTAPEPLHIVAKRNGIPLTSRATSIEEALACARLAYLNVGFIVSAFEDECRILVTRARSMGRGGQSQDRYRRKVHSEVALNIKEIKHLLDEKGIRYELRCAKADYGCSRGEFRVRCPKSELHGIRQRKGPDVQIKILPIEKKKLEFTSLAPRDKSVILGIDPGTTTALAVVDLDGKLLEVFSSRNFSFSKVLSFTTNYDIAIVASDVAPAPKFVEKVSSSLNSVLFAPAQTLSVADKVAIVNEKFSRSSYANPHERDALAAAAKAYSNCRNTLEQVDKKLEELRLTKLKSEVRKLVLKGESVEGAIARLTRRREEVKEVEKPEAIPDEHRRIIRTLRDEIQILKEDREELQKALGESRQKIAELERKLAYVTTEESRIMRREREIAYREKEIRTLKSMLYEEKMLRENLQKKLNELQRINLLESSGDLSLLKVIPQFTKEKIFRVRDMIKSGDVLYILDASGGGSSTAEKLLELNPRAIVADKEKMSHPAREILRDAIIISPDRLKINLIENFGIVESNALEEEIKKEKERMKIESAVRREKLLESIIKEYRQRRAYKQQLHW